MKTSKDPRHQARRLSLGIIYANISQLTDIKTPNNPVIQTDKDTTFFLENLQITEYDIDLYNQIIKHINENYTQILQNIEKSSIEWKLSEIFRLDLAILIIAASEITQNLAPAKVVVDEAVELAKEFSEEDSPKFVNGILAGIIQNHGTP